MSNAGKKMINWRKDFAVLRVALGYLGSKEHGSLPAARLLLDHDCTASLREFCRLELGRDLTVSAIQSRMQKHHEISWYKEKRPVAYRKGIRLGERLMREVIKGI